MELLDSLASDGFGHWLAGLIDGEGSFTISPNRPGFVCRLSISLRADDSQILYLIAERTGIGKMNAKSCSVRDGARRRPQTLWRVQTKADCGTVVSILDVFPLRAKKARDYAIWREAVMVMAQMQPVHAVYWQRRALDWARVSELKQQLAEAREYDGHLRDAAVGDRPRASARSGSESLHR